MHKALLVALAATSFAAAPAAAQNFNGPYVGVNLGYGTGDSDVRNTLGGQWSIESQGLRDDVTSFTSTEIDPDGAVYGVQAGYDYQASPNIVLGAEAEFSLLDMDDRREVGPTAAPSAPSVSYTASNSVDAKHMISLTARAGYNFGNSLLYLRGGVAWVKAKYETGLSSNGGYAKAGSETETSRGFIVGGGIEHKLTGNVSARFDYNYTNQDSVEFDNAYLPGSTFTSPEYTETYRQDLKLHLFRVGFNYRF